MARKPNGKDQKRDNDLVVGAGTTSDEDYRVGPGRPPKEHQFKPGQSGNPKGAQKRKPRLEPELRAALKNALSKEVKVTQGERTRTVTMAQAGIEQLVAQFARGDRHARRDLISLAEKLGMNLFTDQREAIEGALDLNLQEILDRYVDRRGVTPPPDVGPVFAPPELADDDGND